MSKQHNIILNSCSSSFNWKKNGEWLACITYVVHLENVNDLTNTILGVLKKATHLVAMFTKLAAYYSSKDATYTHGYLVVASRQCLGNRSPPEVWLWGGYLRTG